MMNQVIQEIVSTAKSTGQYFLSLFRSEVRRQIRTAKYNERLEKIRELTISELEQELSRSKKTVTTLKMLLSTFGVLTLTSVISGGIIFWRVLANVYLLKAHIHVKDVPLEEQNLAKLITIGFVLFGVFIIATLFCVLIAFYSQRVSDINDYEKIIKEKNEN